MDLRGRHLVQVKLPSLESVPTLTLPSKTWLQRLGWEPEEWAVLRRGE